MISTEERRANNEKKAIEKARLLKERTTKAAELEAVRLNGLAETYGKGYVDSWLDTQKGIKTLCNSDKVVFVSEHYRRLPRS